jgi:hypothetical protein
LKKDYDPGIQGVEGSREKPKSGKRIAHSLPMHFGSEMVDFDFEQGLSDLATTGIVHYFEDFQRAKTPLGVKICRF